MRDKEKENEDAERMISRGRTRKRMGKKGRVLKSIPEVIDRQTRHLELVLADKEPTKKDTVTEAPESETKTKKKRLPVPT